MPVVERERLSFKIDLSDPKCVYHFPEIFVGFLKDHDRDFDAQQFLAMAVDYMERTPVEEYSLEAICKIASMYADIYDTSGVAFEENAFLASEESQGRSNRRPREEEGGLEEAEDDAPLEIVPEHPEVLIEVTDGHSLEDLIYSSILGLKMWGYRKSADRLAREARQLTRDSENVTALDFLRLIDSYVTVELV